MKRRTFLVSAGLLAWPPAFVLAGCGSMSVVADQSTPAAAVRTYVAALVAGDRSTSDSMLSPEARERGEDGNWRNDPPDLTDLVIGEPTAPQGILPPSELSYVEVLEVPVTFDIDTSGSDGFSSGFNRWGFRVVRNRVADPWMISSSGL